MRFSPHAPSIVTINDPFAFTYPHGSAVARWREQQPIRHAIRKADRIFTISEWGARELVRLFDVDLARVRVVRPALDAFWKPVPATTRDRQYVLFVAGPDARKNAGMLFQSFNAAFEGAGETPVLLVAGTLSESDERRFEQMKAPHDRIHPSNWETRTVFRCARRGGSLAGGGLRTSGDRGDGVRRAGHRLQCRGAAEACDGAALLVDPKSVRAWRDALERLCSDPLLRAELRERGLERAARINPDAPARALLESVRQLRADPR